jgi:hypothetical protein
MSQDDENDDDSDDNDDLAQYEADLSQDAFLHYRQLASYVATTFPAKHHEFRHLLLSSITNNKDPVDLETLINSWQAPHP